VTNRLGSIALSRILITIWIAVAVTALYLYWFKRQFIQGQVEGIFATSVILGYSVYLIMGCVRGFTLIPASYLVLLGLPFFSPLPLFIMTLVGILVSSSLIYLFAESLRVYEYFARKHGKKLARIRTLIQNNELPIVIGWSFFPLVPTDLICYVCGTMKVNFKKCLLGIFVGEGLICAIYIFAGNHLLKLLHLKS
jgi:uncharacterized membrane protein YdjX (TVP38/TMEM64 family)